MSRAVTLFGLIRGLLETDMIYARAALILAGLTTVVGGVGLLGAFFRWADSINYLTPVWFWTGLCTALIALLALRGRPQGLAWAALAALLFTGGVNIRHGSGASCTDGPASLTIVQFNVSKGNLAPARSAAWILDQQADIVVLQEAAVRGAEVKKLLRAAYPHATDCLGDAGRCSTVILSRQAPTLSEGLALGDPENRKTLSAVRARFVDEAGPFTVVGVHLRRPWPYDDQTNDVNRLSHLLQDEDPSRLIIAGDFNQPPWTFAMRRQDKALRIPRLTGTITTWPSGWIALGRLRVPLPTILPIDHLYAGQSWQLASSRRGPHLGSEHRPLVIALAPARDSRPDAADHVGRVWER